MPLATAIIVDDLAADRELAAWALQRAGWCTYLARNSLEAEALLQQFIAHKTTDGLTIITDLHMPADPSTQIALQPTTAGAQFALRIRARMERRELPRIPIIALTALKEQEIYLTALAFGCDAVLAKPATPNLAQRIEQALVVAQTEESDAVGLAALLKLLRCRLAEAAQHPVPARSALTEQDITKALLAYRRQGVVGLGKSALAHWLTPNNENNLQRGEVAYDRLQVCLAEITRLGVRESFAILSGELSTHQSPAELCNQLGISPAEYYRRRREAVGILLDLITQHEA